MQFAVPRYLITADNKKRKKTISGKEAVSVIQIGNGEADFGLAE